MEKYKVAIDCDDAATDLKTVVVKHLKDKGIDITDLDYSGSKEAAHYPEIGYNLAKQVQQGTYDRGILICGTGLGMAMVANKVEGVFAGTCHDVFSAERLKKSNDAQVITMGSRVIGPELAKMIVDAFLNSEFQGGRSQPKVDQMRRLEKDSFGKK
jgi:ribose 5-phosphate isomerase B